jgi:ABC-type nitrate/sulfonate/bicarbonate transport system substrate-binding protein
VAYGQQLERSSLKLGVANKAHLYYLPLTVAERRGHFKDHGLTIATGDFEGGGQSLEALLAGSVDVVTGAYEHTLHTQAKGQDIRAVIELGRFPGIVLAVGPNPLPRSFGGRVASTNVRSDLPAAWGDGAKITYVDHSRFPPAAELFHGPTKEATKLWRPR